MKNNQNYEILISFQKIVSKNIQKLNFSRLVRKINEVKRIEMLHNLPMSQS